ncbi:MAG: precorrin-4 C(11)-methyltransferase [Desulfobacterales bacterium]|nr:precorrin-4 C(11)-methyltransferase [Desulfobacterales bacterium]
MNNQFPVIFVGAGPGDPELMTIKGQKALMNADVVIYTGSLVPEAVLQWTQPNTEKLNSASMTFDQVHQVIVDAWNQGKQVIRLHTGDPSLYGAIFEQMAYLDLHNIPYSVIPGITAAFAASAAMKIEYTLPGITQTLILTRIEGRTPVPETEALSALAQHQTSMAIYLSIHHIDRVSMILKEAYGEDQACAVAYKVSQPEEKIIRTTLAELANTVQQEGITHQALIIVSKVLNIHHDDIIHNISHQSRLYAPDFSHTYRQQQERIEE